MIKSIVLRNFQSHKETVLDFHPGVNVIMGRSRGGKSAIFRGFRWLIRNKPGGDKFRSDWGGDTEIILTTDTDVITRAKTDKENKYVLNDSIYKAFGAGVPEDIEKALNLNEVNFQSQFELPFLLAESYSSGDVAKHFNKIAHIEKIDTATKFVKTKLRGIEQDLVSEKKTLKSNKTQLQRFEDLDKFEIQLEALEGLEEEKLRTYKNIQELTTLCAKLEVSQKEEKKYRSLLESAGTLIELEKLHEKKKIAVSQRNSLLSLQEQLNTQEKALIKRNSLISLKTLTDETLSLQQTQIKKKEEVVLLSKKRKKQKQLLQRTSRLEKLIEYSVVLRELEKQCIKQKETRNKIILLEAIQGNLSKKQSQQKSVNLKLQSAEETFHTNFPDICPLCGERKKKKK